METTAEKRFYEKFTRFLQGITETAGYGILLYADTFRRTLTCGQESKIIKPDCTTLHFDNPVAENILYHSGDFSDGYFLSFATNNALLWLFPKMPETYRIAASVAAATGVVSYVERNDPFDIPAGVLGSLAYIGFHKLLKKKTFISEDYPQSRRG